MRLVVSGGGTGGHVYPALTVIETLLSPKPPGTSLPTPTHTDILWIGSRGGMEDELVKNAGLRFVGLAAGGIRGLGLRAAAGNAFRIARGIGQAQNVLARFKPDVVLVTGGYVCVSVTLAAWLRRVPVLIYLPDIEPGLAIRFLSRFAARVAVTSEESYHHLRREKVTVTGYPVRRQTFSLDRVQARRALDLDPEEKTLLVFGGSQGARSINQALVAGLRELLPTCQIIHISGRRDADWVAGTAKSLPDELRTRYHHYAYMDDMPQALVAADLAVARAGAATMGEFPAAGLPAVLVPYPYSGQHQKRNAEYMSENGAARMLFDENLQADLVRTILELLDDEEELASMRESSRAMARPDAAESIIAELWRLARRRTLNGRQASS